MSDLQIADLRLPLPEFNLGVGSLPLEKGVEVAQRRIARVIEPPTPTRSWSAATPAPRSPAPAPRSPPACRCSTSRPACAATGTTCRRSTTGSRPTGSPTFSSPPASTPATFSSTRASPGTVHVTGDVLADVLLSTQARLPEGGEEGEYVLATAHRNYNTDSPERLGAVLDCLRAAERRVIFPMHPRTRKSIETWDLELPANVEVRDPLTYTQMLVLERGAAAIATDSGGVQREAYLWGVPCITMREETEWIETVSTGWNTLVGVDAEKFARRPRQAAAGRAPADLRRRPRGRADRRADRRPPRPSTGEDRCLSSCESASSAAAAWAASTSATTPSSTAPSWSRSPTRAPSRGGGRSATPRSPSTTTGAT